MITDERRLTVRGSPSAGRSLTGRGAWLAVITAVVVLASSQLLYIVGACTSYARRYTLPP